MLSDIRYAFRSLRQSRGFTAVALIALALGIGANTAMFSVVYSVLLKPLPYRAPDRLVWVAYYNKRFKMEVVTGPDFIDWRSQSRSFDPMAASGARDRTLTAIAEPFDIRTTAFSESLGRLFGVQPVLGRDFLPAELLPGATSRPAIISDRFFRRFFHGDRAALGATLVLDNEPITVVGVLPADFRLALPSPFGPQVEADAILPLVLDPAQQRRDARGVTIVQVVGRLRPGVSLAAARAELTTIQARLPQLSFIRASDQTLMMQPLRDRLLGNTGRSMVILLGAVAFVLLIACANVANLLLTRAAGRRREIAVRMALGAKRSRLVRQALTESLLLALGGGAAGLLLAAWCLRLIVNWNVVVVPRLRDASLDPAVLLFAFAISACTVALFGIAPAWAATRANMNDALKLGSGSVGTSPGRRRLRGMLVVAEVALSLVLLAGAGLMVKSLWLMRTATSAAAPERVLASGLQISNPRFRDAAHSAEFIGDFVSHLESVPGVRAAAVAGWDGTVMIHLEGSTAEPVKTDIAKITPHFFTAAGIRLVKGRLLTEADRSAAPLAAVINEALARRFVPTYPRETPVGLHIPFNPGRPGNETVTVTIVGVVADFRRARLDAPVEPQIFLPAAQSLWTGGVEVMARAVSDPNAVTGAIRSIGRGEGIALLKPQTLAERLDASIAPRRFEMTLLIVFASLALLLALVGIYGVVAYMVTQRTREIGVRVALGAQRSDVIRLVLGGGLKLVCGGVAVGLAGSMGLTQLMESFLYGVKPTDAWTFAAVSILLIGVAAIAAWIPARRAAGVDPLVALRWE
jgi:putative ABC transport system permease protein